MLASVVLGAAAQMFLKAGMLIFAETGDRSLYSLVPVMSWLGVELSAGFCGSGFCPFFDEELSLWRVVGIGLILAGVALVTRTEGRAGNSKSN